MSGSDLLPSSILDHRHLFDIGHPSVGIEGQMIETEQVPNDLVSVVGQQDNSVVTLQYLGK